MLSPIAKKIIKVLPNKFVVFIGKRVLFNYVTKYANLTVEGFEKIDKAKGAKIFICNHLSNSDGIVVSKLLTKKYDPYFIAGVKLNGDIITNVGMQVVKHIEIKPGSADKEAITKMVKTVKGGENIIIFPEGTRSRTGSMIEAKKGILLIGKLTKANIIPIGISGTEKLLPIDENGDMGSEIWKKADVNIKIGDPVIIPTKEKEETKQEYEKRAMQVIMGSIAKLLPEKYRGVYNEKKDQNSARGIGKRISRC